MNKESILCKPEEFNAYIYRKNEILETVIIYLIKRLSQIDLNIENDVLCYLSQIEHKNLDIEHFSKLINELSVRIKTADMK